MTRDIAMDLIVRENELFLSGLYDRPDWAVSDWQRYPENPDCLKIDVFKLTSSVAATDEVSGFLYFRFGEFLRQHAMAAVSEAYDLYFADNTRPCMVDTTHWHRHIDRIGLEHRVYLGQNIAGQLALPVWAKAGSVSYTHLTLPTIYSV